MMQLIQCIVQGRNDYALSMTGALAADKGLDFDTLTAIMRTPDVPFSLRTRCCRLLCAMYVDRDPHHELSATLHAHTWSCLNQTTSGVPPQAMQVNGLKDLLVSILHQGNLDDDGSTSAGVNPGEEGADVDFSKRAAKHSTEVEFRRARPFKDEFRAEIVKTLSELLKLVLTYTVLECNYAPYCTPATFSRFLYSLAYCTGNMLNFIVYWCKCRGSFTLLMNKLPRKSSTSKTCSRW